MVDVFLDDYEFFVALEGRKLAKVLGTGLGLIVVRLLHLRMRGSARIGDKRRGGQSFGLHLDWQNGNRRPKRGVLCKLGVARPSRTENSKRRRQGSTYRVPLPRQAVVIQRIWMEVFSINLYEGWTVEVDR